MEETSLQETSWLVTVVSGSRKAFFRFLPSPPPLLPTNCSDNCLGDSSSEEGKKSAIEYSVAEDPVPGFTNFVRKKIRLFVRCGLSPL